MTDRKKISAKEFERIFDEGEESIIPYLDLSTLRRPNLEQKRVNIDIPEWMINSLDRQADIRGITRQSLIKTWLFEKLRPESTGNSSSSYP